MRVTSEGARVGLVARRRPAALTAAAAGVAVPGTSIATTGRGRAPQGRLKGGRYGKPPAGSLAQAWQYDAWAFFDTIGALKYAARFIGHALSRVQLVPAIIPDDGGRPVPIEQLLDADDPAEIPAGIDRAMLEQAVTELARIRALIDGQSGLMRDFGINLTVAGDCYLVATPNDDAGLAVDEKWNVYSVTELIQRGVDAQGRPVYALAGSTTNLPTGTVAYRIYQPHQQRRNLADSPVRGILDDLEELALLNRSIRSTAKSRIAASGLLTMPEEISFEKIDPDDPDAGDIFDRELIKHLSAPLADEGSVANVVPHVIRGKAEFLHPNYLRHIVFDRPLDPQMAEQRKEKLTSIGIGLDLPASVITGLESANHWSAWQVDESTYKSHIEPLLILLFAQLSSTVYRDLLEAANRWQPEAITRVVIIGDASALVDHPDQSADAFKAYDALELSGDALRRYANFKDEDKPSPEEIAERVERERLIHARGAVPELIPSGDVAPGGPTGTPAVDMPPAQQQAPAGGRPPQTPPPPPARVPPARTASAVTAAVRGRPVGERLAELDLALYARVHGMVQVAVRRQLERAGAQITSKAQRDRAVLDTARAAPKHAVAAAVGRPLVAALGLTDAQLTGDYSDLLDQVDEATDRNRRRGLALLVAVSGRELDEAARIEYEQQAEVAARLGRQRLQTALTAFTSRLMYDPNPLADDQGEGVEAGDVPPALVRGALATYGGQDLDEDGHPVDGGPLRAGTASGELNLTAGASLGLITDVWEWAHGSPLHPFEPHEDLDGQVFGEQPDDDTARLANTTDLWLGTSEYFPGDHDGCTCWSIPLISVDDVGGGS